VIQNRSNSVEKVLDPAPGGGENAGMTDIPLDFAEALQKAGLADFFTGCTGPHQREYLQWIGEAKRPATRADRIGKAVKMLADKRREEAARLKKKSA
jgi:uncharacterized protein YdeI (YjbR/CyaY-like superfamily)